MLYNIKITIAQLIKKQYLCTGIINQLIIAIMKEKLTKNVRMSYRGYDLRSITRAFEMVLAKWSCRDQFLRNWGNQNLLFVTDPSFKMWKKIRKCYPWYAWLSKSFNWSITPEGYDFWKKINEEWEKWCFDYIQSQYEG